MKEKDKYNRKICDLRYKDFIFTNRKGLPTKNSAYNMTLYKLADKAGIRPKTLQEILRYENIGITMNLYVHVTDGEKEKEIKKFEQAFKVG